MACFNINVKMHIFGESICFVLLKIFNGTKSFPFVLRFFFGGYKNIKCKIYKKYTGWGLWHIFMTIVSISTINGSEIVLSCIWAFVSEEELVLKYDTKLFSNLT